jgi:octaprenyl-diphosphate synthase
MNKELLQELASLQQMLTQETSNLHPTLSEFFRGELARKENLILAPMVLAAGFPETDTPDHQQQRINLAGALEMLAIALGIHKLLVQPHRHRANLDKSLVGGTVLAGDYCFSKASALAVRTGNSAVVVIFSQLLMEVSEGNLQRVFETGAPEYHDVESISLAGARAASLLANLPDDVCHRTVEFSGQLSKLLVRSEEKRTDRRQISPRDWDLAPYQLDRWETVVQLLLPDE